MPTPATSPAALPADPAGAVAGSPRLVKAEFPATVSTGEAAELTVEFAGAPGGITLWVEADAVFRLRHPDTGVPLAGPQQFSLGPEGLLRIPVRVGRVEKDGPAPLILRQLNAAGETLAWREVGVTAEAKASLPSFLKHAEEIWRFARQHRRAYSALSPRTQRVVSMAVTVVAFTAALGAAKYFSPRVGATYATVAQQLGLKAKPYFSSLCGSASREVGCLPYEEPFVNNPAHEGNWRSATGPVKLVPGFFSHPDYVASLSLLPSEQETARRNLAAEVRPGQSVWLDTARALDGMTLVDFDAELQVHLQATRRIQWTLRSQGDGQQGYRFELSMVPQGLELRAWAVTYWDTRPLSIDPKKLPCSDCGADGTLLTILSRVEGHRFIHSFRVVGLRPVSGGSGELGPLEFEDRERQIASGGIAVGNPNEGPLRLDTVVLRPPTGPAK